MDEVTRPASLSAQETRALANFGPHGPAKADQAPPPTVTRPAKLSALETRALANIGPNDLARADRAPPPKVTRRASSASLETCATANTSPSRPSEPRRRHDDRLLQRHEPLLQRPQERRHPQQLSLDLSDAHVSPPPFSRGGPRPLRLGRDLRIEPRRQLRDGLGGLVPPDPQLRRQLTEPAHRLHPRGLQRSLQAAHPPLQTRRCRGCGRHHLHTSRSARPCEQMLTPILERVRSRPTARRAEPCVSALRDERSAALLILTWLDHFDLLSSTCSARVYLISTHTFTPTISDTNNFSSKIDHSAIAYPPGIM
jgi:hypothetical protein